MEPHETDVNHSRLCLSTSKQLEAWFNNKELLLLRRLTEGYNRLIQAA